MNKNKDNRRMSAIGYFVDSTGATINIYPKHGESDKAAITRVTAHHGVGISSVKQTKL